jgi:hypothetical protein
MSQPALAVAESSSGPATHAELPATSANGQTLRPASPATPASASNPAAAKSVGIFLARSNNRRGCVQHRQDGLFQCFTESWRLGTGGRGSWTRDNASLGPFTTLGQALDELSTAIGPMREL